MSTQPKPVIIVLRPITRGFLAPADRRLARLLKAAKHYGWRATSIREASNNEPTKK